MAILERLCVCVHVSTSYLTQRTILMYLFKNTHPHSLSKHDEHLGLVYYTHSTCQSGDSSSEIIAIPAIATHSISTNPFSRPTSNLLGALLTAFKNFAGMDPLFPKI